MNDERDNHSIHTKVTDYSPATSMGVIAGLERARLAKRLTDFEKSIADLSPKAQKVIDKIVPNRADHVLALGRAAAASTTLPTDAQARKATPICSGVLDYFPAALAEIARVSKAGNDQHNPGQPLHWARGKSMDHADCIIRHTMERGTVDSDGMRHSAKAAWRALALLQQELEAEGAPVARGAK